MEKRFIEISKKNLNLINFEKIVFYSYACGGAMGEGGGMYFLDNNNNLYHYNYLKSKDNLIKKIKEKFFEKDSWHFPKSNKEHSWKFINLGCGNMLYIVDYLYEKFIDTFAEELCEDIKSCSRGKIYSNWKRIAMYVNSKEINL